MSKYITTLSEKVNQHLLKRLTALEAQPIIDIDDFGDCVDILLQDLETAGYLEKHATQVGRVLDRIDDFIINFRREHGLAKHPLNNIV